MDTPSSWPGWLSLSRSSVASFILSWGRKNESLGLRDCCRTENTTQITDSNPTAVSSRPEYLDPNVIKETDSSWRLNTAKTQCAWHTQKKGVFGWWAYLYHIYMAFFVNSNAMKCQWRPRLFKIRLKEERYRKSIMRFVLFCIVFYNPFQISCLKNVIIKCILEGNLLTPTWNFLLYPNSRIIKQGIVSFCAWNSLEMVLCIYHCWIL